MLQITIPSQESWDEREECFVYSKEQTLTLEHSLVSISKWESKWHIPFLGKEKKTEEQMLDYVRCMTLTQNVDPEVYNLLTDENYAQIKAYIDDSMTATWFTEEKKSSPSREQTTAELIYYWMIALNIPFECQKWHLNRLLTLVKICSIKNQPPKKLKGRALANRNASLNAARRKQHAKRS